MGKIKLTESQIMMLQSFENALPKRKVVKLTAEQYKRIFESENPHEFNMGPKTLRPSSKVSKNFTQGAKDVPDSDMKFENQIQGPTDIEIFGTEIIRFLKSLLTDPSENRITSYWRKLNVSKEQLTNRMFELGMIGHGIINGKRIIKIMKNNFIENIKTLHGEYRPQTEGIVQMGDDIEMTEISNDDIKTSMSNQLKRKEGPKPSQDSIKAKLLAKRAEEMKRREAEKNRPLGEDNYPAGARHDSSAPYNQVDPDNARKASNIEFDLLLYLDEFAIFEKNGKYFIFNVEGVEHDDYAEYADREETFNGYDEDGMPDVDYGEFEMSDEVVSNYVNDNHLTFGKGFDDYENGIDMVEIDQEIIDELLSVAKYIKDPKAQQNFVSILTNLTVSEVTAAAGSSGAFVGKMGMNAPITGLSPADEMKNVVGEVNEDHEDLDQKIGALKYKNFQHPALGVFFLSNVHTKHEDDNKVDIVIGLRKDEKESDSELIYSYNKKTGKDELIFNHGSEMFRNAYDMFDELYKLVFDGIKDALRPTTDVQEQGIGGGATYDTPGFPASDFMGNKGKKGKAPVNKGVTHKKTMYPKGKMVKVTESQMALIKKTIVESNNQTDTAYPDGGFVKIDDCTKFNNNKEAQNGGCSTGAKDNVVKTKQTKGSVVSDDALYSEVAKKTGRTIAEVKKIIQTRKG